MGLCSCVRSSSIQETLNAFWVSLPIRQKEIKDIVELTKAKKSSIKPIPDKKWLLFQDELLVIVNFKENCLAIFDKALKLSRDKGNEGYLFLSLLFFSISKDPFDYKINFIKLGETVGGIKESLKTKEEDKITRIQLKTLYNIINFYVNLITLLPCEYLVTFSEGNEDFQNITSEMFSIENQKTIVNNNIMKKYQNNTDEWVDFDKFVEENYTLLKNGDKIREMFVYPGRITK